MPYSTTPFRFSFLPFLLLLAVALILGADVPDAAAAGISAEKAERYHKHMKHTSARATKLTLRGYSEALAEFMPVQEISTAAGKAKSKSDSVTKARAKAASGPLVASMAAVKSQPQYNAAVAQKERDIKDKVRQLHEEGRLPQSHMNSYSVLLADMMPRSAAMYVAEGNPTARPAKTFARTAFAPRAKTAAQTVSAVPAKLSPKAMSPAPLRAPAQEVSADTRADTAASGFPGVSADVTAVTVPSGFSPSAAFAQPIHPAEPAAWAPAG